MEQNRFILRNEKKILTSDTLQITAIIRFNVKKMSFVFNISLPVYLHIIKIDLK